MINYNLHKSLGLCTKCSKICFKNTVYCKKHWLSNVYNNMTQRCKNPTLKNKCYVGISVKISRKDFVIWGMSQNIEHLNRPSIDRIDASKDYEINNIKFIELIDNILKDKKTSFTDSTGRCYVCKQTLPIDLFVKDNRKRNNRSTICLSCERLRSKNKKRNKKSKHSGDFRRKRRSQQDKMSP